MLTTEKKIGLIEESTNITTTKPLKKEKNTNIKILSPMPTTFKVTYFWRYMFSNNALLTAEKMVNFQNYQEEECAH
jgi:hypothetical protein